MPSLLPLRTKSHPFIPFPAPQIPNHFFVKTETTLTTSVDPPVLYGTPYTFQVIFPASDHSFSLAANHNGPRPHFCQTLNGSPNGRPPLCSNPISGRYKCCWPPLQCLLWTMLHKCRESLSTFLVVTRHRVNVEFLHHLKLLSYLGGESCQQRSLQVKPSQHNNLLNALLPRAQGVLNIVQEHKTPRWHLVDLMTWATDTDIVSPRLLVGKPLRTILQAGHIWSRPIRNFANVLCEVAVTDGVEEVQLKLRLGFNHVQNFWEKLDSGPHWCQVHIIFLGQWPLIHIDAVPLLKGVFDQLAPVERPPKDLPGQLVRLRQLLGGIQVKAAQQLVDQFRWRPKLLLSTKFNCVLPKRHFHRV